VKIKTKSGDIVDLTTVRNCIPKFAGKEPRDRVIESILDALEAALSVRKSELPEDKHESALYYNAALHDVRQAAGVVEE